MIGFLYACGAGLMLAQPATAQSGKWPLTDLSAFRQPGGTWQIAGDVSARISKPNALETVKGTGVLVNLPGKKQHGEDLYSNFQHGDIDLELDYMMAAGSNSGIYFQGRYEFQLFDSWGNPSPAQPTMAVFMSAGTTASPKARKATRATLPARTPARRLASGST
ncbi:family 16 glycoside hydrolase [Chitinophaga pollutisoli]|uniref:Family 16 glycoside hydrolase n=1 Tax=Chitinophaga pollutisoli TaxID=3133966 RepID=A0ABZ2YNH9_9BACT